MSSQQSALSSQPNVPRLPAPKRYRQNKDSLRHLSIEDNVQGLEGKTGKKKAMKDFRDLKVWEKAHELALDCYRVTSDFPKHEIFGVVSQIRRSGSSIAANIAEGCGRGGNAEFQRFLQIAMGSASELEYHILLSRDLHFLDPDLHDPLRDKIVGIKKMLAGLIRKVDQDRRLTRA